MHPDIKTLDSKGFYFYPSEHGFAQSPTDCSFMAHFRSTRRRFLAPGIPAEAIIVRHYGYRGQYNDQEYLTSQYAYVGVYDAMRQVQAYKEEECEGRIEILLYTDTNGLEPLRYWNFEVEGFVNMDGEYEVENWGWDRVKV